MTTMMAASSADVMDAPMSIQYRSLSSSAQDASVLMEGLISTKCGYLDGNSDYTLTDELIGTKLPLYMGSRWEWCRSHRGYKKPMISQYCQCLPVFTAKFCSEIPLAIRFIDRDRLLWNSMVQGIQRFR